MAGAGLESAGLIQLEETSTDGRGATIGAVGPGAVEPRFVVGAAARPTSLGPDIRLREVTMIATAATITAPAITVRVSIGSWRISAPRMTATIGFT